DHPRRARRARPPRRRPALGVRQGHRDHDLPGLTRPALAAAGRSAGGCHRARRVVLDCAGGRRKRGSILGVRYLLPPEPITTIDAFLAAGGGEGLAAARRLGPSATVDEVAASGLRGRGGGGFPT